MHMAALFMLVVLEQVCLTNRRVQDSLRAAEAGGCRTAQMREQTNVKSRGQYQRVIFGAEGTQVPMTHAYRSGRRCGMAMTCADTSTGR